MQDGFTGRSAMAKTNQGSVRVWTIATLACAFLIALAVFAAMRGRSKGRSAPEFFAHGWRIPNCTDSLFGANPHCPSHGL
jgi:hypothetical protein